jgi:uncharacterized protein YqcC (DUF446 family)
MSADYSAVEAKIGEIEAAMKKAGAWQDRPLDPQQLQYKAAFGLDKMAFSQWLQFILIPNVRRIIAVKGKFPTGSQAGGQALREFDTEPQMSEVTRLLCEFDAMFT